MPQNANARIFENFLIESNEKIYKVLFGGNIVYFRVIDSPRSTLRSVWSLKCIISPPI